MRPACISCNKEMEWTHTGILVGLVVAGRIYQVWAGDEATCSDCGTKVVTRYAKDPLWERHQQSPASECRCDGDSQMKPEFDSYTGDEYKAGYVSQIPDIRVGRSPFYRYAELARISAQYHTEPGPRGGVRLRRAGTPSVFFPELPALTQAVAAMDWCVLNDASISIVVHWLSRKEIQPYLELLERFMGAANAVR